MDLQKWQRRNGEYYQRQYDDGHQQGLRRRAYLLANDLSLETMHNNHYRGSTFRGLYGYMAAMQETKETAACSS